MNLYLFMANALVVFHFCFVLFVIFGGFFVVWRKWMALLHVPCASWGILVESLHLQCPLTRFENQLRESGGGQPYDGGFVERYIMPVLYPHDLTADFQVTLAIIIALMMFILYTTAFTRQIRKRRPMPISSLRFD